MMIRLIRKEAKRSLSLCPVLVIHSKLQHVDISLRQRQLLRQKNPSEHQLPRTGFTADALLPFIWRSVILEGRMKPSSVK